MQKIHQLTTNFTLKKHFFISFFAAFFSVLICYFVQLSNPKLLAVFSFKTASLSALCGILIVYGIYKITFILDKIIPWKKQIGNRLFIGLVTHLVFAFFTFYALFFLYDVCTISSVNFTEYYKDILIKIAIVFFILILIYEVIYFALYSYYSYATLQIETVKQERKQIELQLKALKSQLSPHFLFNSLNIISSLVYKDKKLAENFIRRLAKMYDYTLQSYHSKLIFLNEELDFAKSYLYLLQTRFENKFTCSIAISDDLLSTKIPPLTLQMLIENAVKHNQIDGKELLKISITSDEKHIIVHNNLTKNLHKISSFNIGLKNINSRYLLLCNKGIVITNGQSFTVKIPIIK